MDYATATSHSGAGGISGAPKGDLGVSPVKEGSPCEDEVTDLRPEADADIMKPCDRNVKLVFPIRRGEIYKPVEILQGLKSIVSTEKILGLGVLSGITEWNVLMADEDSASLLTKTRRIRLTDGTVGIASRIGVTEAIIRVQWLPMSVDDGRIRALLDPYGHIEDLEWETYVEPELKGIRNGVRRLRMTLKDQVTKEDLPHRTNIDGNEVLCTVYGRRPRCLRCNTVGHFFKECPRRTKKKTSFADKVRGGAPVEAPRPAPDPTSAKIYEEVAVPLLQELDCLTTLRSDSALKDTPTASPMEEESPITEEENGTSTPVPQETEVQLSCSAASRKRARVPSPVRGRLWADEMDSESECSTRSAWSSLSTEKELPKEKEKDLPNGKDMPIKDSPKEVQPPKESPESSEKNSACLTRKPEEVALERLRAQRARVVGCTEFMDPALRDRVLEVMEYFGDEMLDICAYMPPGTTYKKFKKKNYGIYQELRRIEKLYEDYRLTMKGPVDPDLVAAAMDDR